MNRTGRTLILGCLSLVAPLLASAGDNSLLVPAIGLHWLLGRMNKPTPLRSVPAQGRV